MKTFRLLFSDAMARAIASGSKTVTRRPVMSLGGHAVNPALDLGAVATKTGVACFDMFGRTHEYARMPCAPGDILIGRECWRVFGGVSDVRVDYRAGGEPSIISREVERIGNSVVHYLPDVSKLERPGGKWRPSIHMPDWAARIRRRVVSVTVERLQDITEDDAVREGVGRNPVQEGTWITYPERTSAAGWSSPRESFRTLWESIYAAKGLGWDVNPWCWRIEFERENVQEVGDGR